MCIPATSGADVMVYVLDTGIYKEHSAFEGRAGWGQTFIPNEGHEDEDAGCRMPDGHGTHVAGTMSRLELIRRS